MLWPLLDLDPNSVRAGWLPLGLVLLLGLCIVGLYFSMRHEVKKVDVPARAEVEADEADEAAVTEDRAVTVPPAPRAAAERAAKRPSRS